MCSATVHALAIANQLLISLKEDEMVSLYVEDCDEPYKVPRSLLNRASKWFRGALNGNFVEGQKLELRFPGTTTATLESFCTGCSMGSFQRAMVRLRRRTMWSRLKRRF